MPRQLDLTPGNLQLTNSPLNRINMTPAQLQQLLSQMPQMTLEAIEQAINDLIGYIDQVTGLNLQELADALESIDFSTPETFFETFAEALMLFAEDIIGGAAASIQPIIDAWVNTIFGLSGTGYTITDFIRAIESFPAEFLIGGPLQPGQISHINIGALSSLIPEFLVNPNFDTATAILGQGVWTWDGTQGPAGVAASIYADAAGVVKEILSNPVAVAAGQILNISGNTKWSGFSGAANSIALTVAKYSGGALVGYDTIGSIGSPGVSGAWTQLSNTAYTVPAGITSIALRPVVTNAATAGRVWFGKLSIKQTATSLAQNLITNLENDLQAGLDSTQALLDTIYQTLTSTNTVNQILSQLVTALQNYPNNLVTGYGGPANIGATFQTDWNQLISGFVGTPNGVGAVITDLQNVGYEIASMASLGQMSFNLLGIRNNKSVDTGFLNSSNSNLSLNAVALQPTAPTFTITQSTAITAFERMPENGVIGVVSWLGYGVTNITDFRVNIWKMNTTTGDVTLVHNSANIIGSVLSAMGHNIYSLPTPISILAGDVYGFEFALVGSGSHTIAGQTTWMPNHPTVYPKNYAALRNSGGTGPPASIASASVVYTTNVPFVEFGVSAGSVLTPTSPENFLFNQVGAGSVPIPDWANYVDVIALGAGGGGNAGGFGTYGNGGTAGQWGTKTWVRGTDFTGSGVIVSATVTSGGAGGTSGGSAASGGGATTVSIPGGHTVPAAGGAAGAGGIMAGGSPGSQLYNGTTYIGGIAQVSAGGPGVAPGGAAAGGTLYAGRGGNGAPGCAWLVFRQS